MDRPGRGRAGSLARHRSCLDTGRAAPNRSRPPCSRHAAGCSTGIRAAARCGGWAPGSQLLTTRWRPAACAAELCSDPTSGHVDRALRTSFTASDGDRADVSRRARRSLPWKRPSPTRSACSARRGRCAGASRALGCKRRGATGWSPAKSRRHSPGQPCSSSRSWLRAATGRWRIRVSPPLSSTAEDAGVPAWAVIGVGRALPERLFESAAERGRRRRLRGAVEVRSCDRPGAHRWADGGRSPGDVPTRA